MIPVPSPVIPHAVSSGAHSPGPRGRGMAADHLILEAEKSAELVTAFRLLGEAADGGQPRFPVEACRAVERAITCRTYASALLELCHLARAASSYRGRYFELFWAPGPMRAGRLRALFAKARPASWLKIGPASVELIYTDGGFTVTYGRMPVLVALAEFLLTALGFKALDETLAPLALRGVSVADVSRQANALSRAVYNYLKAHLPPLQAQRKLGAVIDFLKERNDGDFDLGHIDDAAVLDFWRGAIDAEQDQDFRTFTSVFLAFARFRDVFEQAAAIGAIEHALPIGSAVQDGEVDPADVATAVEIAQGPSNPLDELQSPPSSRIKFFNAKERECLAFLFQCGRAADALPLSFLRAEVFGRVQSRLSQALRTARSPDAVIAAGAIEDYRARQVRFREMAAHGRTMLLAAAYVMHETGLRQFASAARAAGLDLALDLDSSGLDAPHLHANAFAETVVPFRPLSPERKPTASAPTASAVDAFLADARKAARQVARAGFRPDEIHDADVQAGFVAGCPLVAAVLDRIGGFSARLAGLRVPEGDWAAQFSADSKVFATCFSRIYGAAS